MSFTGEEDHSISIEDAAELTKNYRNTSESGTITAEFFGREALESILAQEGCVGIRCYYGKKEDGTPVLVLVGVNANEEDMLEEGKIMQDSKPCPPNCASVNTLNS
jgi:hypothetical protein